MKKLLILLLIFLIGCGGDSAEQQTKTKSGELSEKVENIEKEETSTNEDEPENETLDENESENEDNITDYEGKLEGNNENLLANYTSDQIEYARVWLQLGPNQNIDQLYVNHIPEGAPLNPDEDLGVAYPEDVIQLTSSRNIDGIVTYSGNGDGTINVYNVPLRW